MTGEDFIYTFLLQVLDMYTARAGFRVLNRDMLLEQSSISGDSRSYRNFPKMYIYLPFDRRCR